MSTEVTTDMAINFKLFGFKNTIRFADIGVASADIFVSLGGNCFNFFIMFVHKKIFRRKHRILIVDYKNLT